MSSLSPRPAHLPLTTAFSLCLLALAGCGDDGGTTDAGAMDAGPDAVPGDTGATDGGTDARPGDGGNDAGADAALDAGPPPAVVDATTLSSKLVMGYQGWFAAAGDGSRVDGWRHWSPGVTPAADTISFDMWPDLSELGPTELFDTAFRYADDGTAGLYSAYTPATVRRHFEWMRRYGIDGVMLQEFVVELSPGSPAREFRDRVTDNVRDGAEMNGRVFALMYDISGADPATFADTLTTHWRTQVDAGLVDSDRYLHHRGRPLVAIWGLGFTDRVGTPADARALIDFFHAGPDARYHATVLGGVPTSWRTLDGDSKTDPTWADVYRSFDVISPWTVGRFADDAGARRFRRDRFDPDLAEAERAGADYLPVVWPGFSWANLMAGSALNQIPRRGGRFWWTQVYEAMDAGATMIYGAMFDEVDEGTAMFKIAATAADTPTTGRFVTLDADGEALPSDFYLRLAGEGSRMLRGERPLTADRPFDPGAPLCDPPHSAPVGDRCVPSCGAAGGDSCDPAVCMGRPTLESYDCEVCCSTGP